MSKLSKKTNIIIKMIKMLLSRDEVALLVDMLQQKYNLKQSPQSAPKQETSPQASATTRQSPPKQSAAGQEEKKPRPQTVAPREKPTSTQSREEKTTEETLPLEVIYSDGKRSKLKRPVTAVGVIIPQLHKLLYYDGSENIGTRDQAHNYIRNLPKGYNWHLMRKSEAIAIRCYLEDVNRTLERINGLPIDSRNYMLEGDRQSRGYVRYVADI